MSLFLFCISNVLTFKVYRKSSFLSSIKKAAIFQTASFLFIATDHPLQQPFYSLIYPVASQFSYLSRSINHEFKEEWKKEEEVFSLTFFAFHFQCIRTDNNILNSLRSPFLIMCCVCASAMLCSAALFTYIPKGKGR